MPRQPDVLTELAFGTHLPPSARSGAPGTADHTRGGIKHTVSAQLAGETVEDREEFSDVVLPGP